MNVVARNYSSGAEIIANANAIRQRLMRPKNGIIEKQGRVIRIEEYERPQAIKSSKPTAAEIANEPKAHLMAWTDWKLEETRGVDLVAYVQWICRKLGFDHADVVGPSRTAPSVAKRHRVMHEAYIAFPGVSLYELGKAFGGRDHSTVWHGLVKMGDKTGSHVDRERRTQYADQPEVMETLKRLYLTGIGPKAIADQTGISMSTVHRLARDYNWKVSHLKKGKE